MKKAVSKKTKDVTGWYKIRTFAQAYREQRGLLRAPGHKTVTKWCKKYLRDLGFAELVESDDYGTGNIWRISPEALTKFTPPAPGPKAK